MLGSLLKWCSTGTPACSPRTSLRTKLLRVLSLPQPAGVVTGLFQIPILLLLLLLRLFLIRILTLILVKQSVVVHIVSTAPGLTVATVVTLILLLRDYSLPLSHGARCRLQAEQSQSTAMLDTDPLNYICLNP
jgi:hypothetical protein